MSPFFHFSASLGYKVTPEEQSQVFGVIDIDGDGTIDFDEFYNWWISGPSKNSIAAGMRIRLLLARGAKTMARLFKKSSDARTAGVC